MEKQHIIRRDKRLQDIAHILSKAVLRMKNNGVLLTTRYKDTDSGLQKPLMHVNQPVC